MAELEKSEESHNRRLQLLYVTLEEICSAK